MVYEERNSLGVFSCGFIEMLYLFPTNGTICNVYLQWYKLSDSPDILYLVKELLSYTFKFFLNYVCGNLIFFNLTLYF